MIGAKFIRYVLVLIEVSIHSLVFGQNGDDISANRNLLLLGNDAISWSDTIPDIIVIGDSVFHYANRDVYRITKHMRRHSKNTGEVLGKIPGIYYSRFDKSLSYYGEQNILILIDSIKKNADYVKRLHHLRFDKVEVIPQPDGQYAAYDAVINLHSVSDYEGYENDAYVSEQLMPSALDNKLFDATDWSESFTYSKKNLNFSLHYKGNFYQRGLVSYGDVIYIHNDYKESIIPNADHSSNSGRYNRVNCLSLDSDYQINKRSSFSILYKYDNEDNCDYYRRTSVISDISDPHLDTIQAFGNRKEKGHVHSVGLYYRGGAAWRYNLTFNYVNHTWNSLYHIAKTSGYANTDNRHQRMNHTTSKIDVSRSLIENKLYFMSAYTYFWRKYDQSWLNTNAIYYKNTLTYHSLWGSCSYNISRTTGASVSGTATFYDSETGYSSNKYHTYYVALGFVSKFPNNSQFRFSYGCSTANPTLDQLSANGCYIDSLIWKVGNPNLKASLVHDSEMRYNFFDGVTWITRVTYAPRNFVCIIESEKGVLQNGVEGYYAVYKEQNGKNYSWVNTLNVDKDFGTFSVSANVSYSYFRSKYYDYKRIAGAWTGNCELTYEFTPCEIYLTGVYKMINNYIMTPQSIKNNRYDVIGFAVHKSFCDDNLELMLSYITPLHFNSLKGKSEYTTPAVVSKGYNDNKFHVNNALFLSLSYKILGGKSIRKYKKDMSNEK